MRRSITQFLRSAADIDGTIERLTTIKPPIAFALKMRRLEPYLAEVLLSLACLWSAKCLVLPSPNRVRFPNSFKFLTGLAPHVASLPPEHFWALYAFAAASLKLIGIGLLICKTCGHNIGVGLRCVGLTLSVTFWTILAVSFAIGDTNAVSVGSTTFLALISCWVLMRLPMLPGEPQ